MQNTPAKTIFSEVTEFLATNPTPQAILDYRLPDHFVQRAHELLDLNGEGQLSQSERDEMMDYVRVDKMMTLLRAKMKRKLHQASANQTNKTS